MKRATIEDVAALAGVSRQTVSRAINNKDEISPATKDRVLQAVSQLGYQPNRAAQSMVTRRTLTVGLVFADILNPFFPEVARGVQDVARDHNYNVFLCNTDDNPDIENEMLQSLVAYGVDGIIILGSSLSDADLKKFADSYRPIAMTNRFVEHPNINLIIVDNIHGGALAAEHLIANGHTVVGMITNENSPISQIRRVQGFREKLAEHGLPNDETILEASTPTINGGYQATKKLLNRQPNLTGLFAYNDLMGIGAIRACSEMNLAIPNDISIIGFDDIHLTSITSPSLTSVRVDKYAIGAKAMTRLLEMLEQPDTIFPSLEMPVELVLRESTNN